MISSIIAVLGAIVSAAVGGAISYYSQRSSSEEAVERLYYQHTLEERFTAFRDLYLAWDDVFRRFKDYNSGTVTDVETFQQEIGDPFRDLYAKSKLVSIYLDDGEQEIVESAMEDFDNQFKYLRSKAEKYDDSYLEVERRNDLRHTNEEMTNTYNEVKKLLKSKIDPRDTTFSTD